MSNMPLGFVKRFINGNVGGFAYRVRIAILRNLSPRAKTLIRRMIRMNTSLAQPESVQPVASDLYSRVQYLRRFVDYTDQDPIAPEALPNINDKSLKLNWVIPDFVPGNGGHMTIFRVASHLEKLGHEISFLIQNPSVHKSGADAFKTINEHFQPFSGDVDLFENELPVRRGDALIATDRFTCYPVRAMTGFRRKFYFVQDYETQFYPMGTEALLSENTYHMGLDCLCAGDWLANMMSEHYGLWARSWPLAFDAGVYNTSEYVVRNEERIAFYARFVTPRRAVELGMMALDLLHQRGVRFHVDFFGWDIGHLDVQYSYTNHGVLTAQELGNLYRRSALGVVFSGTNHSLVNKEMMACGTPVIDLDRPNVRAIFPDNVIQFVKPEPVSIADGIGLLLRDDERRSELSEAGSRHIEGLSWEASARQVEAALIERLQSATPEQ